MSHKNTKNPCNVCPPLTTECESLPSALDNFINHFFGQLTKTLVDGKIVWTLPCDLATGIPGYPRAEGEGLACYFKRLAEEVLLGQIEANGLVNIVTGYQQPAEGGLVEVVVDNPVVLQVGAFVWGPGAGWYEVVSVSGATVVLRVLFGAPFSQEEFEQIDPPVRLIQVGPLDRWDEYIEEKADEVLVEAELFATTAANAAQASAQNFAQSAANAAQSAAQNFATTAAQQAENNAKAHSDSNDVATLAAANAHADAAAATAEQNAKDFASTLEGASTVYVDAGDAATLVAANAYTDISVASAVSELEEYADNASKPTAGRGIAIDDFTEVNFAQVTDYTEGGLPVATGAATIGFIDAVETGSVLLSAGVGTLPVYGKIDLGVHVEGDLDLEANVTGELPVVNGGTGAATAKGAVTNLVTVVDNAGTSITLADSDSGTVIRCTSDDPVTVTVPDGLAAGFNALLIQQGEGQIEVVEGGTAEVQSAGGFTMSSGQYAVLSVLRVEDDVYNLAGNLDTTGS